MIDLEGVSERIRRMKEKRRITWRGLGAKSGITHQNILRIVRRESDFKISTIDMIAGALECRTEWLIFGTGDEPE